MIYDQINKRKGKTKEKIEGSSTTPCSGEDPNKSQTPHQTTGDLDEKAEIYGEEEWILLRLVSS